MSNESSCAWHGNQSCEVAKFFGEWCTTIRESFSEILEKIY